MPDNIPPAPAYLLLKNSLKLFQKPWQELEDAERQNAVHQAAEEFRLQKLVLTTKEAMTVSLKAATVEGAIAVIRERFSDDQAFHDDLHNQGLDEATLRQAVADELRVDAVLSLIGQQAGAVTEAEAAEFYRANQEKFDIPEIRKARHILITVNDDFAENRREASLERIQKLQQQLKTEPEKFSELVQQYSECPSALRGGELGEVPLGHLSPALDQVLFGLAPGEMSDIVETHLGFHLVLCESIKPARLLSFEEAAPRIQRLLTRKKQQKRQKEWLEGGGGKRVEV